MMTQGKLYEVAEHCKDMKFEDLSVIPEDMKTRLLSMYNKNNEPVVDKTSLDIDRMT